MFRLTRGREGCAGRASGAWRGETDGTAGGVKAKNIDKGVITI